MLDTESVSQKTCPDEISHDYHLINIFYGILKLVCFNTLLTSEGHAVTIQVRFVFLPFFIQKLLIHLFLFFDKLRRHSVYPEASSGFLGTSSFALYKKQLKIYCCNKGKRNHFVATTSKYIISYKKSSYFIQKCNSLLMDYFGILRNLN